MSAPRLEWVNVMPSRYSITVSFSLVMMSRIRARASSARLRQQITRSSAWLTMHACRRFSCPSFFHPSTKRRMYKLLSNGLNPYRDHRWDFPCCVWSPLLTCRRQCPGRTDGILFALTIPSASAFPETERVGSCISLFEACSAFTHVTACMLAESPIATLCTRGFSSLVASTAAPIATWWSEPVPGRV